MRGVEIDPAQRIARVEAGAQWQDVTHPAAEHGLAALAGSSPDVGVVGYTLGGGLSWLARRHGIAANSVVAIEIVTADGALVRTDADNQPDLFWALRGGGGNFGVVTAIEFSLFEITSVYAGMMLWPIERATEVLEAYSRWTETADEDVTSTGRLLNLPPIPDIPEPFRGRSFVGIEAVFLGGQEVGERSLAEIRALAPELDTFADIPMPALSRHAHGSRAPRARGWRRHPARGVRPGGDLRAPRRRPARGRTRRCCRSRSGISAAQLPARATATVCWPASRRRSRCSASASR